MNLTHVQNVKVLAPLSEAALSQLRPLPIARALRLRLRLTQDEFAARYHIPLGTLRDWEQRRSEPDMAAQSFLRVIAAEPEKIAEYLARKRTA